jgi:hypothetical protein
VICGQVFTSVASIVFLVCKTQQPSTLWSYGFFVPKLTNVIGIDYGAGQHFLLLTVGQVTKYLRLFYVLNINLNLAATFIKLSLLFQFLRIFERGTWPYRASVIGIVAVTLWGSTFFVLSIFPCATISDAWNIFARDARCWAYGSQDPVMFTATLVSHNTINTFFDIYITAIPLQMYFQPDVTLRTRLGLMVLLLMGAVYVFAWLFSRYFPETNFLPSVVTLSVWRVQETVYYKAGWYPTRDPTWYGPKSILLMVLEVNVASICASVPIFWPVLRPILGAVFVTREFSVKYEPRESISSKERPGDETGLNAHYQDSYVMVQVDPFGFKDSSQVQGQADDTTAGKKDPPRRGF